MANPSNTFVARIIRVYALPAGATVAAYNSPLTGAINLGEFTTDGLKWNRSRTTETISSNNAGVVRTLTTDSEVTLGGTLLEESEDVTFFLTGLRAVNGVITDDGRSSWSGTIVADEIDDARGDGSVKYIRTWIPAAETTATDERTASAGGAKTGGFTATAYPSELIGGGKYRQFVHETAPTAQPTGGAQGGTTTEPDTTEPEPVQPPAEPADVVTINAFFPQRSNAFNVNGVASNHPNAQLQLVLDFAYTLDSGQNYTDTQTQNLTTDLNGAWNSNPINVFSDVAGGTVTATATVVGTTVTATRTQTVNEPM